MPSVALGLCILHFIHLFFFAHDASVFATRQREVWPIGLPPVRREKHHARADTVDIGDTAYAAPLVDDLDGDGYLDVLVATMSGNVLAFGTPAPWHPMSTWPAQVPGLSGFAHRLGWVRILYTWSRHASGQGDPARPSAPMPAGNGFVCLRKGELMHE